MKVLQTSALPLDYVASNRVASVVNSRRSVKFQRTYGQMRPMLTRKRAAVATSSRPAGAEIAALAVLVAGVLTIPAIFTQGDEAFRLPKELAFRAEGVALLAVAVFWATSRARTWCIARRPELASAAIIAGWALVAAALSTNRLLSADIFIPFAAAAVIFVVPCVAAQRLPPLALDVLMIGACANAALVILQDRKLWMPLK